jgi:hypothetical protein
VGESGQEDHVEDAGQESRPILTTTRETVGWTGFDGRIVSEQHNNSSGATENLKFLDHTSDYELLKDSSSLVCWLFG